MTTVKLTLSVAPDVIDKAKRISKRRKTSVSAMFASYISALDNTNHKRIPLLPMTKRALELAKNTKKLSESWDYRDELKDILEERYFLK
jgi:hypothetical protein